MMCVCVQNDLARVSKIFKVCTLQLSQWFPRKKSAIAMLRPCLDYVKNREHRSIFLTYSEQNIWYAPWYASYNALPTYKLPVG